MKRFVAAFEDELVKLAAPVNNGTPVTNPTGAAPRIPQPTFHQSTGKPMGAMQSPNNAGAFPASSAMREAIPVQEMRSPPREKQSDGWRPSPGFKPYAPTPAAPAPGKSTGGKGGKKAPGGPLRDRLPFQQEGDYLKHKTHEVFSNAATVNKNKNPEAAKTERTRLRNQANWNKANPPTAQVGNGVLGARNWIGKKNPYNYAPLKTESQHTAPAQANLAQGSQSPLVNK